MKRKSRRSRPVRPNRPTPPQDAPLVWRDPQVSDELHEAFMRSVWEFENAPTTTLAQLLIEDGIELPCPDTFTEESVHGKLWEIIRAMARHTHYLESTDHLSDLALYRHLWERTLNDPFEILDLAAAARSAWHIDLADGGSGEPHWLRYYATEEERRDWADDFPDQPLPERAALPYDRDRLLPKWPLAQGRH